MKHIDVIDLELNFPYMIGTLKNGERRRVDIRDVVEDFKNNKYAYPHMKQLLDKDFFEKGKLEVTWGISWTHMVDLDTFVFEDAEII